MKTPRANPTITVQVTNEQRAQLDAIAGATDRKIGYVVRLAIDAYLASQPHAVLDSHLQTAAAAQAASPSDRTAEVGVSPARSAPNAPEARQQEVPSSAEPAPPVARTAAAAPKISDEAARAGALTLRPVPKEKP